MLEDEEPNAWGHYKSASICPTLGQLLIDQGSGRTEPNMWIVGSDYHPIFQQIAWIDTESRECGYPTDADWVFASPYGRQMPVLGRVRAQRPYQAGSEECRHHEARDMAHVPPFTGQPLMCSEAKT